MATKKITVDEFWKKFLKESGRKVSPNETYTSVMTFGSDQETSSFYILSILAEKCSAISSSYYAFEIDREPLPKKGNLYVLTDFDETPYAVLETTEVTTLPFNCVPWDLAKKENEGESLEEWRAAKEDFFEEDSDIMGYDFTPSMPVVFEVFKVIYRNL